MKQEKITASQIKKYLSLFEKAGIYWLCLLLIPGMEVLISAMNALFYQKTVKRGDDFRHAAVSQGALAGGGGSGCQHG